MEGWEVVQRGVWILGGRKGFDRWEVRKEEWLICVSCEARGLV